MKCLKVWIGIVLLVLAGCETPTEFTNPIPVPMDFDYAIPRQQIEAPFFIADTEPLVFRGNVRTLCSPSIARAEAHVAGDVLELTIISTPDDACFPVTGEVGYQATVGREVTSFTQLRVIHTWKGTNLAPDTVVTTTIPD